MIVPQYWAEGRVQHKQPGKQVTVRRFGWSDESQEDAQAKADERARDALRRILDGSKLARREMKDAYGGAEGLPIREEIISRHGDAVVTRNSYGALCLNTPNVMFVDVDVTAGPRYEMGCVWLLVLIAASAVYGYVQHSLRDFGICLTATFVAARCVVAIMNAIHRQLAPKPREAALQRIEAFAAARPDWHLRVYETPAGYRLLVMHEVFDAKSAEVAECFAQLKADSVYSHMCHAQNCFRARLTPKPWRIGITQHMRPRPGVWPVKPQRLPVRQKWVAMYEAKAAGYAACRFLKKLGSGRTHPDADAVRVVHDDLSRARLTMPLA